MHLKLLRLILSHLLLSLLLSLPHYYIPSSPSSSPSLLLLLLSPLLFSLSHSLYSSLPFYFSFFSLSLHSLRLLIFPFFLAFFIAYLLRIRRKKYDLYNKHNT
ncbi:hypothetical protein BDCR2A_01986 [Borrelia duttonii CR2A]|uniref:Uncharacterized protein n=1 Tax=Borrelia duttonii CR2A TaxID=1432657 RepID=W6TET2_9SPIR|nr:hypothetical protein BDCR2A_01986 [Borrelia duttonii CR2A]